MFDYSFRIHIMSGTVETETQEHMKTFTRNLKFAAEMLKTKNIIGVIEPINKYSLPNYFLNSYEKGTLSENNSIFFENFMFPKVKVKKF